MPSSPPMPIPIPIRYLLELDRLQNNFPYNNNVNNENYGRHCYLVATPLKDDVRIVGFCDIDGRMPLMPEVKNEVIGSGLGLSTKKTTMTTVHRPCPYFSDLVVHPSHRRRGVASSLASEAECRAKNNWKYHELFLCIRLNDDMILRMYIDRGYEIVEPSKMSRNMIDFLAVQDGKTLMRRSLQG